MGGALGILLKPILKKVQVQEKKIAVFVSDQEPDLRKNSEAIMEGAKQLLLHLGPGLEIREMRCTVQGVPMIALALVPSAMPPIQDLCK